MQKLLDAIHRLNLTPLHITLASLFVAIAGLNVMLPLIVLYRDSLGLYALVGIAGIGMVAATALRPQLGIYILAVVIFTNVSSAMTDNGLPGINKPLVGLIIVSVIINSSFSKVQHNLRLEVVEWSMIAYGLVLVASSFGATDKDTSLSIALDYFKDFIILLCVIYALQSTTDWKLTFWLVIGGMTFVCILCTYQIITGDFKQTFWGLTMVKHDQVLEENWQARLSGPFYDPNFFGQILVSVFPLALYRFIIEKQLPLRIFGLVATLLISVVNLNTYSRGSFLTMSLALFLSAIERRVHIFWFIMAFLSVSVITPFLPAGYSERLETLKLFGSKDRTSVYKESSFRGRSSELLSGWNMFLDHPILGVGAGNYQTLYQDYAGELGLETRTTERHAHCLYVEILAESGVLGMIAFTCIFLGLFATMIQAWLKAKKLYNDPQWGTWIIALLLGMVSYLLAAIFLHGAFLRNLWFMVALGISAVQLTDRMLAQQETQQETQQVTPVMKVLGEVKSL